MRTFESRTRPEAAFYTDDGTLRAFQNEGLEAALVNLDSGETISVIAGLTGSDYVILLSPDNRLVATFVDTNTGGFSVAVFVSLWDAASGELLFTLTEEGDWAFGAFSPDSQTLAAASPDGPIVLWDTATGERLRTIRGHTQAVSAPLVWSPDGTWLASAANDGTVVIWDTATTERQQTFEIESGLPRSLAVSPDGSLLAVGTSDGRVLVWDLQTGAQVAVLTEHTPGAAIDGVQFSRDGTLLVTAASRSREIMIWQVGGG